MGRRARDARREAALTEPDPYRFTTIAHARRDILGPVAAATLDELLARIAPALKAPRVLDVGCGKAEILVRALERFGGSGIGVEPNPAFASDARDRVMRRLPANHAVILERALADAELPAGSFTLGLCTGALHAFGDWRATLQGMSHLMASRGWALFGPGYWKRTPHPDYLGAIEGEESEQHSLPETLALAEDEGWQMVACRESTPDDWDDYEGAYAANMRRWCDEHPRDPDAKPFRDRIERWTDAYRRWGRDTMGYALVLAWRG